MESKNISDLERIGNLLKPINFFSRLKNFIKKQFKKISK
jgi:hypothetical protein